MQRAAAAAMCEPRLLGRPAHARQALKLLAKMTAMVARASAAERKSEAFKTLRQGQGYCWSVAVAARPAEGQAAMEKWLPSADPDARWRA